MRRLRRYLVLDEGDREDDSDEEVVHTHTHHHYHHPKDGETANVSNTVDNPVMHEVREHLANPPATWRAYAGHSGEMMSIVEMEYRELMQAKESGAAKDIKNELIDLAAACIQAAKTM